MALDQHTIELRELVLPSLANHHGSLFAGHGLQLMSKAAFLSARSYAQREAVMAGIRQVHFLAPTPIGCELLLRASVHRVGRSSMSVAVTGWAQAPDFGTQEVLQGVFEMVAIDAGGQPVALHHQGIHKESTP